MSLHDGREESLVWSLNSLLIKPVQRVLKYPLLLGKLVELSSQSDAGYKHLLQALEGLQTIAQDINELRRRKDIGVCLCVCVCVVNVVAYSVYILFVFACVCMCVCVCTLHVMYYMYHVTCTCASHAVEHYVNREGKEDRKISFRSLNKKVRRLKWSLVQKAGFRAKVCTYVWYAHAYYTHTELLLQIMMSFIGRH